MSPFFHSTTEGIKAAINAFFSKSEETDFSGKEHQVALGIAQELRDLMSGLVIPNSHYLSAEQMATRMKDRGVFGAIHRSLSPDAVQPVIFAVCVAYMYCIEEAVKEGRYFSRNVAYWESFIGDPCIAFFQFLEGHGWEINRDYKVDGSDDLLSQMNFAFTMYEGHLALQPIAR